jgi:hypothetical protein
MVRGCLDLFSFCQNFRGSQKISRETFQRKINFQNILLFSRLSDAIVWRQSIVRKKSIFASFTDSWIRLSFFLLFYYHCFVVSISMQNITSSFFKRLLKLYFKFEAQPS